MSNKKIFFLHIPKTAGTSLREIIIKNYGIENCYFIYSKGAGFNTLDDFKSLDKQKINKYKVFMGHVTYNTELFKDIDAEFVTFIRNPIDRIISYYQHIMNNDTKFAEQKVSLLRYLENSKDIQLHNHQVRVLSNLRNLPITNKHLVHAKQNYKNKFLLVGLVEDFHESIKILSKKYKWKFSDNIKANVSKNKIDRQYYSKLEISKIKAMNELDFKFYRWVKNRKNE